MISSLFDVWVLSLELVTGSSWEVFSFSEIFDKIRSFFIVLHQRRYIATFKAKLKSTVAYGIWSRVFTEQIG